MKNRIAFAIAALVAGLSLSSGSAHAASASGPLTEDTAHFAATYVAKNFLAQTLPRPFGAHVEQCHIAGIYGGKRMWHCPAKATGGDTACTATVWVWGNDRTYFVELHRLRCTRP